MNSPGESQLWCPGQSLWSLIAEHVSESELLKIRAELGHSVVDMYTEVHTEKGPQNSFITRPTASQQKDGDKSRDNLLPSEPRILQHEHLIIQRQTEEAVMWHKMWQGRQQHGNHNIRAETPFAGPRGSPLPDPPVVKELVRAEVKMLLQTLKEKAGRSGRDDEELFFGYKPETVHYALGHQEICHNSSVNVENTDIARSRPNSCCSVQSSAEDEIESIRDKLNVKEIHKVVARLRSVLLSESESLSIMTKIIKRNIKQTHQYEPYMTEPSLTELRELRAAVQTDLKLLPSSPEVSSPPPVKKNNFRTSAGKMSDSPPALTPASILKPDLTSLSHLKPRPPSPHPPTKTSLFKTHGFYRFTSASNKSSKPPPCNRTVMSEQADLKISKSSFSSEQDHFGVRHRACPNVHINSERSPPSPENHLSSQSCVHLPGTDLSPRRQRKNSSDAGSYSGDDTGYSGSTEGKTKAQDGQQASSSGNSSESKVVQSDNSERMGSSRSSVVSETPSPPGRKKHESLVQRNRTGHLRMDTNKQQGPVSCSWTDNASHPPKSCGAQRRDTSTQPMSAETNGKYVVSPENTKGKQTKQPRSDQQTQAKSQIPKIFHQPVRPARMQT